ncbi:MAG TPA: GAF domain-containing protein, partial [Polyangia bacterium]
MFFRDYVPVLEVMADAIVASDPTDQVLYVNAAAERLLGWSRDELVGRPLTSLMPERMRPLHEAGFHRYISTGKTKIMGRPVRVPALRKDGAEIDIELTLSPLRLEGKSEIILASLRDLRDRVELERQLVAQQRLAAQHAVMAVFAESTDTLTAIRGMLRAIGENLNWPLGNFWQLAPSGRLERTASWQSSALDAAATAEFSADISFAKGEGLPGRVWASGEAAWIVDLAEDSNFPRQHTATAAKLHGAFAFPVVAGDSGVAVAEFFCPTSQAVDEELRATAQTLGRQIGQFMQRIAAHQELERAEMRARFLADASSALATSVDYETTLRHVAELAVPKVADWCTVVALDAQGYFRRIVVVHRDSEKRGAAVEYQEAFPPSQHRAGQHFEVFKSAKAVLQRQVSDEDLKAAAQDEKHLRLLRDLGCTSCIMVPLAARGESVGVISLMRCGASRPFDEADLTLAEQLSHRAALAIDNSRLFASLGKREQSTRFLSEASAVLNSSLDYEETFQKLTRLAVPRFADWCSVEIVEGDALRQVSVAHVDPAKIQFALEIQKRYPVSMSSPTGAPHVIRTGEAELYEDIPDELLVQATRDAEHLRLARALGLRSALTVPLSTRGRTIGALTLVWAESGRHYAPEDLPLMQELGRRAALAVENARLYSEAQRAIQLRDEFLSIASHELRTPLTGVQLQVEGIQRLIKKSSRTPAEWDVIAGRIDSVGRSFDRLSRLVEDLLDVSSASAGRLQLKLEEVHLSEVVHDVLSHFEDQLSRAGCAVSLRLDSSITGRWDRLRLHQILSNFLANALKYAPGKPIEVTARRDGAKAVMSVRDHGIGVG